MTTRIKHVILTGGTGYIGESVADEALRAQIKVTLLCRSPLRRAHPLLRHVAWELGQPIPRESLDMAIPSAAQAMIHLAHDWRNSKSRPEHEAGLNMDAAKLLLASGRQMELGRIVFVSSQSARKDAANIYGRTKWAIEQEFDRPNEVSARVGLVYGAPRRAMFGLLCRLTEIAPILPMIDPWRMVQPIKREEVAAGLLRIADSELRGWVGLAAPQGMPFGDFLTTLAREYFGRRLLILPVPLRLALVGSDIASRIPFFPEIDRERILGLAGTLPMSCADHLAKLQLTIAPLERGLRASPQSSKTILREAYVLLSYVLRSNPGTRSMRNYARTTRVEGEGPLPLSFLFRLCPSLLRLIEPLDATSPLSQRLSRATLLAEASPEGEQALSAGRHPATRMALLAQQFALDVAAMPFRLIAQLMRK